ncbi:MAG: hypothetical protein WCR52_13660, partial [Bacteroidota bacterium]
MDLQKTKIYLDKLNREYTRMYKDPENTTRIDVDIMLSYVRELYDALLSDTVAPQAPVVIAPAAKKSIAKTPEPVEQDAPAPAPPPPPAPPPVPPVAIVREPAPIQPPPPPPVEEPAPT